MKNLSTFKLLGLAAVALASIITLGVTSAPAAGTGSEVIFSGTATASGTVNSVTPLVILGATTNLSFVVSAIDVLVLSSSAVTASPTLTIVSGTAPDGNAVACTTGTTAVSGTTTGVLYRFSPPSPQIALTTGTTGTTDRRVFSVKVLGTALTGSSMVIKSYVRGYYAQ